MKLLLRSCALILAVLLLSAPSLSANGSENVVSKESKSPKHPNTPKQQSKPNPKQRGTEQPSFPLKEINSSQHTQDKTNPTADESESKSLAKSALWGTWFQAGVLVVTLLLMAFVAVQQLRAYVFIDAVALIPTDKPDVFNARMVIKNSGKTPAYGLTCTGALTCQEGPPSPFQPPKSKKDLLASRTDMGPGGTVSSIIKTTKPGARKVLYASGSIRYRHAFSFWFNKDRVTVFRYMYSDPGPEWETCPEGNRAT